MSHGVPRVAELPLSEEQLLKEEKKIAEYKNLDAQLKATLTKGLSREALKLSSEILVQNPEYYTVWNHRRRIHLDAWAKCEPDGGVDQASQIAQDIVADLDFIKPLMLKFPKCYWIWNFRLWLLEEGSNRLDIVYARELWQKELQLVEKMLGRDRRNFHGWRFRRIVIEALESEGLAEGYTSLTQQELDYTTKMIGLDLSNYSAWHYRSKLIPRLLQEKGADDLQRRAMLDEELKLIHEALIDPYDSSLWFYHQTLTASMASGHPSDSIAPALTISERLQYIDTEVDYVMDILEEFDDCKWAYQALLDLCHLYYSQTKIWPQGTEQSKIEHWTLRVKELDPLRRGRWQEASKLQM